MFTDQRTGMRSIRAARETFAAVALVGLTVATVLRVIGGRPGAFAGVILTLIALAVLSRYRVSWDAEGIVSQTPFSSRRRNWADVSAYSIEPVRRDEYGSDAGQARRTFGLLDPCRLRLHARSGELAINLKPYSWQDIRHVHDRVSRELPLRDASRVLVS
jgi:hypothetical protein